MKTENYSGLQTTRIQPRLQPTCDFIPHRQRFNIICFGAGGNFLNFYILTCNQRFFVHYVFTRTSDRRTKEAKEGETRARVNPQPAAVVGLDQAISWNIIQVY